MEVARLVRLLEVLNAEEEGRWLPRALCIWSSPVELKCILLMPVYIFLYK